MPEPHGAECVSQRGGWAQPGSSAPRIGSVAPQGLLGTPASVRGDLSLRAGGRHLPEPVLVGYALWGSRESEASFVMHEASIITSVSLTLSETGKLSKTLPTAPAAHITPKPTAPPQGWDKAGDGAEPLCCWERGGERPAGSIGSVGRAGQEVTKQWGLWGTPRGLRSGAPALGEAGGN